MSINFAPERWEKIRRDSRLWWSGKLKRPLIQFTLKGRDPGRPKPKLPYYGFQSFYDFTVPAEEIIDRIDYELSTCEFLGDAFPHFWPNFGPGVIAAFLGGHAKAEEKTTWFGPSRDMEITELHFEYDADNAWFKRVKDICRAAAARWQGGVQVAMTDLGGNLDILSSFRPSEKLIFDLYDHPDDVKRLTWEAHELWWRYFGELNAILRPTNPGYTAWSPIFSETPYYMLQCDFCYMLGPEMFDEFVKPELAASCRSLSNPFYHLDGPGQLPHLDSLLAIPELKGIQWIPGSGAKEQYEWPEVYRRVRKCGKLIQVFAYSDRADSKMNFGWLDKLVSQLDGGDGIVMLTATAPIERKAEALEFLAKYSAA
jgi:5-methyltetrahydrofolate--homocysteine methyltransferase